MSKPEVRYVLYNPSTGHIVAGTSVHDNIRSAKLQVRHNFRGCGVARLIMNRLSDKQIYDPELGKWTEDDE